MNKRLEKLCEKIGDKALYITDRADMLYYSGFDGEGALVILKGKGYIITDGRYTEAASKSSPAFEVVCDARHLDTLKKLGGKMLFQPSALLYERYRALTKNGIELWDAEIDFEMLRCVKDEDELNLLRKAAQIGEAAFEQILREIKPGVREYELAARLDYIMRQEGASKSSFDTICISGKNTSLPHGVPTDKPIQNGDFVTMDFGCVYGGYCSDMTRTVAVGYADDKMAEVYNTILKAQLEGQRAVVRGASLKEVDFVSRGIIKDAGYGEYFVHSLGHGVGLKIHEQPVLSPKATGMLENGNVVTVEPGIYLPGKFGVRIENTVIVNGKTPESLQKSQKELIIL